MLEVRCYGNGRSVAPSSNPQQDRAPLKTHTKADGLTGEENPYRQHECTTMEEEEKPYTMQPAVGPRGASLEDSYRHVMNLQSNKEASSKAHKFRACPPSMPTSDEYAATMYRLSQLEPVYHDLENDRSSSTGNTRTTRSSPSREHNSARPLSIQKSYTDSSNGSAALRSCWPAASSSGLTSSAHLKSVTGNGKFKVPKSYRTFAAPRKPLLLKETPKKSTEDVTPILMGADPFDTSSVVTGMSQQELLRRKARAVNQKKKKTNPQPHRSSKKKKKTDRILNLPASLLGGSKKPPANKHFAEIYITKEVPKPKETVEPREVKLTNSSSPQRTSIDPKVDSRVPRAGKPCSARPMPSPGGSGDDSFPILSKHPSLSMVEENSEDSGNDSRIVRFSKEESYTHVFDDSSDRPFDEDEVGPPDSATSIDPPAGPQDFANAPSPPSSNRSFQSLNSSSSGGLKSILRPARFSPTKSFPDNGQHDYELEVLNTSISKSPPRGGSGFVDDGVELSPIVKGNRISADGGSSGVSFHKTIEEVNTLYPDPSLEAPTEYSDPTIDTSGGINTDEESMMSTVGFIQNVASIVIQTAFRRYQARQLAKELRETKQSPSPTGLRSQLFPSLPRQNDDHVRVAKPNLDHSLEVRRCFGLPEPQSSAYSEPIVDTSPLKACPPSSRRSRKAKQFDPFEERLFALAAIQIQSVFRGFWVRDCLNVDHYCATVIQHAYRTHCYRMEYKFQVYRIVIVQSIWRRQLARREASFRLGCVLLIQSASRRFMQRRWHTSRRSVEAESRRSNLSGAEHVLRRTQTKQSSLSRAIARRQFSKEDAAATLIQKHWRSFYYETNYLKTLLDVLLVQTAVRRWFAVRRVRQMKAAQQRLKRRHRYVAAASRRRAASRVAPSSSVISPSPFPSPLAGRVAVKSHPAVVTPRGFNVHSRTDLSAAEGEGSVTCSTSDASEDGPTHTATSRQYGLGTEGSRKLLEVKVSSKPPLPTSASKVAVVTPKPWPPKVNPRYSDDYGGSSTGSTSALTEDDVRIETASPPPSSAPCLIEADTPGGAKAILSLWRERDKKNSAGRR